MSPIRSSRTRALPLDMVWQRGRWPEHTAAHAVKLESAGKICNPSAGMQRGVPPELAHMPCQWVSNSKVHDETNPFCKPYCRQPAYWMTGISDLSRTRFYCYKHGLKIWKRMKKYKVKDARRFAESKRYKEAAAGRAVTPPTAIAATGQEAHK